MDRGPPCPLLLHPTHPASGVSGGKGRAKILGCGFRAPRLRPSIAQVRGPAGLRARLSQGLSWAGSWGFSSLLCSIAWQALSRPRPVDEENAGQGGKVTCLKSHSLEGPAWPSLGALSPPAPTPDQLLMCWLTWQLPRNEVSEAWRDPTAGRMV